MSIRFLKIQSAVALFFVLVFFSSAGLLQAQEIKIRIITQDATLYLKPTKESLEIVKLPIGSIYDVLGFYDEWYQIETPPDKNGITVNGFVLQNQTEKLNQEEVPSAPRPQLATSVSIPAEPEGVFKTGSGMKIGAGISMGYTIPSDSHYKGGPKIGGSLIFIPIKYCALELSGLYSQSSTEDDTDALSEGKLTAIEIGLNLVGRFPIKDTFIPYISAGGCYSINNFKLDADLISTWEDLGFDIAETVENAFGAVVGAGFDFQMVRGLILGIDFKYRLMTSDGTWTFTDQLSSSEEQRTITQLNLNSISVTLGIKYLF
jgi:outer membrane protein W